VLTHAVSVVSDIDSFVKFSEIALELGTNPNSNFSSNLGKTSII